MSVFILKILVYQQFNYTTAPLQQQIQVLNALFSSHCM